MPNEKQNPSNEQREKPYMNFGRKPEESKGIPMLRY
jgi:hypothetical protein